MQILFSCILFFLISLSNTCAKSLEKHAKIGYNFATSFFNKNADISLPVHKAFYEKGGHGCKDHYLDLWNYMNHLKTKDPTSNIIRDLLDLWRTLYFRMGKGSDSLAYWAELRKELPEISLDAAREKFLSWCNCSFTNNEDRLILLLRIFDDLCEKIPAQSSQNFFSKKIVVTSLASGGCLFELLLIAGLLKLGLSNIELNLIDHGFNDVNKESKINTSFKFELERLGLQSLPIINFYTNAYDYIFKVITGSSEPSDIIFGTDYGALSSDTSNYFNCMKIKNDTDKTIIALIFTPQKPNIDRIFITEQATLEVNFLQNITPPQKTEFKKIAVFYKTQFLKNFPNAQIALCELASQTFDDLRQHAGNPQAITYQIHNFDHKMFTQDGAVNEHLNVSDSSHYFEYKNNLHTQLAELTNKLKNLKIKLTLLLKQLTVLDKNLTNPAS